MPSTYTPNLQLARPEDDDEGWGDVCNANADRLDSLAPLAALAVVAAEVPSASTSVRVAPGAYPRADGSAGWFAGATRTLPADAARVLFLDASGGLQDDAAYPAGRHVRLAAVATSATAVASIVDDRVAAVPIGVDSASALGGLAVSAAETPSASLDVVVAPGRYLKPDSTAGAFAGATRTLPADAVRVLFLDASGGLQDDAAYPASTGHVRLATVATSATAVASIVDDRIPIVSVGGAASSLPLAGGTMADGATIASGTTTGLKIGGAANQKLGFWGKTPIARPAAYTQGYATATRYLAPYSPYPMTSSFTGLADGTAGSPYAKVSDLNDLRSAVETLRAFVENATQILNSVVDDLQAMGLAS